MAVNWALGLQQGPNPGERFADAFKQGQETARQNKARAAMAALVQDPNNQGALAALAEVDPPSAMQFREQQQKQAMAGLEMHRENILKGAQLIRQVNPQDQAGWDRVRGLAQQMGIDTREVPPQFDPEYVKGVVSIADAFSPQKADGHGAIPEYQDAVAQGLIPANTSYQQFLQMKNPGMLSPVVLPERAQIVSGGGGDMPVVSSPQEAAKLPPGTQFRMPDGRIGTVPGGQTAAPSATFQP